MKHHSEDYKLSAVKYYLKHNQDMRNTCKIFDCKYQSLARWVKTYKKQGNVKRKTRKNKDIKVTPKIVKFIKEYVKKYPTTTLWEFSKIVNKEFKIRLTDKTIHNILHRNKITRKRLRSRYYPEKREGQEKMDLETFYNELKKYDYKKTICLDETSIYLNMSHSYGISKSGTRVIKRTNKYPYKRYNLLCAISYNKVIGWTLYEYVKGGLKKEHIIDEFFSQLKHYIKKQSPQSFNEIYKTITNIINTKIKSKHLENYKTFF